MNAKILPRRTKTCGSSASPPTILTENKGMMVTPAKREAISGETQKTRACRAEPVHLFLLSLEKDDAGLLLSRCFWSCEFRIGWRKSVVDQWPKVPRASQVWTIESNHPTPPTTVAPASPLLSLRCCPASGRFQGPKLPPLQYKGCSRGQI